MNSPRQLVLLCDGTNNNLSGRHADTHVVLLAELLRLFPDPNRLVYYDPGVGNPGQLPGTTFADKFSRAKDRVNGLAFGRGLYDNVAEGYQFLMANWQPGDQIFAFGFSRGAFTARSIVGMVNAFGIIDSHQDTLVSSLVATYFSKTSPAHAAIREQAARLFGQAGAGQPWPEIHFVGVWDTVASVGLPPFGLKITARPTLGGKHFRHVRQALALDEQRAQFLPRAYAQNNGGYEMANQQRGDIQQFWFRGSHCDVGGGNVYPYSELSRASFAWMVAEAVQCGLSLPANTTHATPATESDVFNLMPVLDPHPPHRFAARVNSETQATPLWALTGLKVRDTAHADVDEGACTPVKMQAHASVLQWAHAFPARTAWGERGNAPWGRLVVGLLVLLLLAAVMGWSHLSSEGWLPPLDQLPAALAANGDFQRWQLSLASMGEWMGQARGFARPVKALLLDFLLIATWAWLLAPWFCRAFARHAGLIQVGMTPSAWLNRAGWALAAAVGADIAEDLLSLVALAAAGHGQEPMPSWPLAAGVRLLLFAASAIKWVALLGMAGLILSTPLRRHPKP
ncbi:T6SS phospholipase effector Tle1-like catalytic domain-containing protein [Roseateles sp. NT4]|uniref:T6SS phospholipase effector Tle1-like catalytic domain-containing protein n=1 Tax=Roseateles sp. NT4 TaxID=3453715 RepID=UPI003EEA25B2